MTGRYPKTPCTTSLSSSSSVAVRGRVERSSATISTLSPELPTEIRGSPNGHVASFISSSNPAAQEAAGRATHTLGVDRPPAVSRGPQLHRDDVRSVRCFRRGVMPLSAARHKRTVASLIQPGQARRRRTLSAVSDQKVPIVRPGTIFDTRRRCCAGLLLRSYPLQMRSVNAGVPSFSALAL